MCVCVWGGGGKRWGGGKVGKAGRAWGSMSGRRGWTREVLEGMTEGANF